MHLIIGLGNFGQQYLTTRHNIGFMACDYWLKTLGDTGDYRTEHKALTRKIKIENTVNKQMMDVLIAKPQTYMNRSGESVVALLNFYKIDIAKMIVVHDDIDQAFGAMKIHKNRGHGGQNGIKNISELLGTQDYTRLKLGVGRPADPRFYIGDYVLSSFSKEENQNLPKYLDAACDAVESFIFEGSEKAATRYNGSINF